MRKAGTIERVPVELPDIHSRAIDLLSVIGGPYANAIRSRRRLEDRIESAKIQANVYAKQWAEQYRELKKIDPVKITGEEKQKAERLEEQLSRHALIETYRVAPGSLTVQTRLLFSNIRLEDGEVETARRCIGAYTIRIHTGEYITIDVRNILYRNMPGHWALSNESSTLPCWGEYRNEIDSARAAQDVYRIIDLIITFLQNAGDGGAYHASHNWIARRLQSNIPALSGSGRVRDGAALIILESRDTGAARTAAGEYYKVLDTINGLPSIRTGDDNNTRITLFRDEFMIVKDKLYRYRVPIYRVLAAIEALDNLPAGSTLSDANSILDL